VRRNLSAVQASSDLRRGRWAFGLTLAALLWALGLVLAAFVVPVYSGRQSSGSAPQMDTSATLIGENGLGALVPVGAPALVVLLVWSALHFRCARGGRSAGYVAWVLIGLLSAFCLLAMFSIGMFVLPVALLLAAAASHTPLAQPHLGPSGRT